MCLMKQSRGNHGSPTKSMSMVKDDVEGGDGKFQTNKTRARFNTGENPKLGGKIV